MLQQVVCAVIIWNLKRNVTTHFAYELERPAMTLVKQFQSPAVFKAVLLSSAACNHRRNTLLCDIISVTSKCSVLEERS